MTITILFIIIQWSTRHKKKSASKRTKTYEVHNEAFSCAISSLLNVIRLTKIAIYKVDQLVQKGYVNLTIIRFCGRDAIDIVQVEVAVNYVV